MSDEGDARGRMLDERIANMKPEVMPERDLWPEIASNLTPRYEAASRQPTSRQPRRWAALGIAVAAGYLLASWFPLQSLLSGLEQQPQPAELRAELMAQARPALIQLPESTRAIIETDLAGFDRDWARLEEAAAADPDNLLLQDLLTSAQNRARAVQDQLARLTNESAEPADTTEAADI